MTWDQAANLVDTIVLIARKEVERSALGRDEWERGEDLVAQISTKRDEAIEMLMGVPNANAS